MGRPRKRHFLALGPEIPIVPVGHFNKRGLSQAEWEAAWSVCGPTVERNMARGQLALWQIITAAYLDGLQIGHAIASETARCTSSLDAITALVREKLPGEWPQIIREALSALSARHHWATNIPQGWQFDEFPRLIAAAFLRALAQEKTNGR